MTSSMYQVEGEYLQCSHQVGLRYSEILLEGTRHRQYILSFLLDLLQPPSLSLYEKSQFKRVPLMKGRGGEYWLSDSLHMLFPKHARMELMWFH